MPKEQKQRKEAKRLDKKERHNGNRIVNLIAFFFMLVPVSIYLAIEGVILNEPSKSAELVRSLNCPYAVNWLLFPFSDVADTISVVGLAEVEIRNKNYQGAEKILKAVKTKDLRSLSLIAFPLARALVLQHKYVEAEVVLTQISGNQVGLARNLHMLGYMLHMGHGRTEEAAYLYGRARNIYRVEKGADSYEYAKDSFNMGVCLAKEGKNEEARENFKTAYLILVKQPATDPALFAEAKKAVQ